MVKNPTLETTKKGYMPSARLRFVTRSESVYPGADIGRLVKILQQLWIAQYQGDADEWRDVEHIEGV